MEMEMINDWFWFVISAGLLVGGSGFAIVGGIGICRLPEFFSRMHGAGITDTMGAGMILLGLMIQAGVSLVTFKLITILFFMLVASPSACHALAHSAIAHGLKPELDVPRSNLGPDAPEKESVKEAEEPTS